MSMPGPAAEAISAPRIEVGRALKDTAITALIAFALFLPLVGFKTVQNMRNELELETRLPLLLSLVAVIAGARLFVSLVVTPWRERRALRPPSTERNVMALVARIAARVLALGFVALAVYYFLLGRGIIGTPPEDGLPPLSVVVFRVVVMLATAFLFYRLGARPREGTPSAAMSQGIALVAIYPALVIAIVGYAGALKWVDNFGIQILIYVMLGWGLNIVVGLAGLLDLGYVAFYAVGAYSYALLAKEFGLSFWILLPLAGCLSAFWGILLGFPVLRLRGDYLAIVTLAFGEIIRLILINWVSFTNGYAGIGGIPRPTLFGIPFTANEDGFAAVATDVLRWFGGLLGSPAESFWMSYTIEPSPIYRTLFLFYVILALALLTAYVTIRLRQLPVGRAWEALREDEIACRSLGINTTNTKLTAFAMGAMFAGFAGSFFAARQGFISPESFTFLESATILAIVVLGGMGSQVGVAIAAVIMIGGTEIMRELDFLKYVFGNDFDPTQYRMLIFGFAMVLIMIWKPRGLVGTREASAFLKERRTILGSLVKEGHG